MRYFKRLPKDFEGKVATSKVVNLSDVFGKDDATKRFVTRYLQTTHCDLFFADGVILVEGSAEHMLLPHFIRNKQYEMMGIVCPQYAEKNILIDYGVIEEAE